VTKLAKALLILGLGSFVLIILGLVFLENNSFCENDIYDEIKSPDGQNVAIIFERGCGATTDFNTQVSIVKQGDTLPNNSGNSLVIDSHPKANKIKVSWENDSLNIEIPSHSKVFYQSEQLVLGNRIQVLIRK